MRRDVVAGRQLGFLTVISEGPKNRYGNRTFRCRCKCGSEKTYTLNLLGPGKTISCGCDRKVRNFKPGSAFRLLLRTYIRNAKLRGIPWELTLAQFEALVTAPCHYTGRPPSTWLTTKSGSETLVYNGIDRLDNRIGYTVDNCVPCCTQVNYMKRDYPYDKFVRLVKEISKRLEAA